MTRQLGGKEKKNVDTSHAKNFDGVQQNSIFGRHSEEEIISKLKELAVDPCNPQFARDNIQALWNQILKIRKVMVLKDSDVPWRKRKLEQFVKDKLRASPDFVCPNEQNITKLSRSRSSHASSLSCLLNSAVSTQYEDEKITFDSRTSSSLLTFDDMIDFNCPGKDKPATIDSDESVRGSNQLSPETNLNEAPSLEINHELQCLNSSIRLLNVIGDHFQRKVIPVGPRFQADVPEWIGSADTSILIGAYKCDSNNSKWLGTRVWPIQNGNLKTAGKTIGKGRPNSCCCESAGSVDCVKRHVLEQRPIFQSELGPAFLSWKFDEMGEQVSNSWPLKEQRSFQSLMKTGSASNGKSFLQRAYKCFSNKNRKHIISYYFNVYIPYRMSLHRSPSVKQVDTDDDDDEAADINYLGSQKKSERKSLINCSPKVVKGRYLRRLS